MAVPSVGVTIFANVSCPVPYPIRLGSATNSSVSVEVVPLLQASNETERSERLAAEGRDPAHEPILDLERVEADESVAASPPLRT
jgi:hypothetical protein